MSSHYDIEMSTDDTLELDTIIKKSNKPINPITKIETSASYDLNDLDGVQTNTAIFDPPESGEYDIHINGQVLSINVKDASSVPSLIDNFESQDNSTQSSDWGDWSKNTSKLNYVSTDAIKGTYSGQFYGDSRSASKLYIKGNSATTKSFITKVYARNIGDWFRFRFYSDGSSGTVFQLMSLDEDGTIDINGGSKQIGSFSFDTTFKLEFRFDFSNEETTIYKDDSKVETINFINSASDWDTFYPRFYPRSGDSVDVLLDTLEEK